MTLPTARVTTGSCDNSDCPMSHAKTLRVVRFDGFGLWLCCSCWLWLMAEVLKKVNAENQIMEELLN